MNKAQLIEALAERLGDKKNAAAAVDGIVDVIVRSVHKGEKVNITGFGVFEKRARAARTARNPRTGETVKVKKTNVPAFRAGSTFKDVISGTQEVRVNFEVRVLSVAGVLRPRDIATDNTVSYDKIAEARISYGGRGRITEVQQPAWGQQLVDLISPF